MTQIPKTDPTLGEFLRQEREKRGITLDQLSSETKISIRVLQHLETDDYSQLPARPFLRGFVTSYVRFLELNPRDILLQYKEFIDRKYQERPDREKGMSGYVFERKEGEQNQQMMLWLVLGAFLLVGGMVVVIFKPSFKHRRSHGDRLKQQVVASPLPSEVTAPAAAAAASSSVVVSPVAPPPPVVPKEVEPERKVAPSPSPKVSKPAPKASVEAPVAPAAPVQTTGSADSQAPTSTPSASEKPDALNSGVHLKHAEIVYKVIVKTQVDCWVRYKVDERSSMKFILRKDKVLVLRAARALRLQTSHPAEVTYNFNSRGPKFLSEAKPLVQFESGETLVLSEKPEDKSSDPFAGSSPLSKSVPGSPTR